MYSIYAGNTCIYNDLYIDEGHRLINPKLTMADNSAGSFTATVPPTNVGYDTIKRISTIIKIRRDGVEIWEGRVLSEKKDFWNNRMITCEGELGYLNDTVQPPAEYHNVSVREFLETLIEIHNAKAGLDKQFKIGTVTVTDSDSDDEDTLYRYTNYETTMNCIGDKLVDRLKGHLIVRKVDGVRYLDYLKDYPSRNTQILRFGKQLLDFTKNWDLTDLATVVVPRGESLDESPIEALTAYLTVESVNNGSIYVTSDEAVKEFGWIEVVIDWQNVTEPSNLLAKAKRYLEDYQFDNMTIELNALDMHYLVKNDPAIQLLQEIRCVSKPHGMDRYFPVTRIEIPLDQPESAVYTLGTDQGMSLSSSSNQANSDVLNQINRLPTRQRILREAQEKATDMIHTATHGYVVLNYDENGPYELLIMDTNKIETATKVWRWNMGGFGYSPHGYAGPYEVAMTMDGSIVANFITTGTMYADRISGGTLTMGGYDNQNGVIKVRDSSGNVCVTIDCSGIKVGNNFSVNMKGNVVCHNIKADGTDFSDSVDDTKAMKLAKEAIAKAQSAADKAQKASDENATTVKNLNNTIIPDILKQINDLYQKVAEVNKRIDDLD